MQEYIRGLIVDAALAWLRALPSQILGTIGWSGVIVSLAGCVLMLTLSAKAVSFMTSKRGMATVAGVMLAALFALWFWRHPAQKSAAAPAVVKTSPTVKEPVQLAKKEPAAEPHIEAVKQDDEPEEEEPAMTTTERTRTFGSVDPPPWLIGEPVGGGSVAMPLPQTPSLPGSRLTAGAPARPSIAPSHGESHAHVKREVTVAPPPALRPAADSVPRTAPTVGSNAQQQQHAKASGVKGPGASSRIASSQPEQPHQSQASGATGHAASSETEASSAQPPRQSRPMTRRQAIREMNRQAEAEFNAAMGAMMDEQHAIQSGMGHPGMHAGGHHPGAHPGAGHHPGAHPGGVTPGMHPGGHR